MEIDYLINEIVEIVIDYQITPIEYVYLNNDDLNTGIKIYKTISSAKCKWYKI